MPGGVDGLLEEAAFWEDDGEEDVASLRASGEGGGVGKTDDAVFGETSPFLCFWIFS